MSHAPGFSGTPETGHCSRPATRASCASSSAVAKSPTMRTSPAMSRADSMRQIASIARCASVEAVLVMARAPLHALELEDLADLEGAAIVGCPLQPLEGLVQRAHLPQPVPGDQLLGLSERPVDDGSLLAVEPNAPALRAGVGPAGLEPDPGAAGGAVARLVNAVEAFEDSLQLVCRYARATVLHLDVHARRLHIDADVHLAFRVRVLSCVLQQVGQDLRKVVGVDVGDR